MARFSEAVYVIHAFDKKARRTPQSEIDLARIRYLRQRHNDPGADKHRLIWDEEAQTTVVIVIPRITI